MLSLLPLGAFAVTIEPATPVTSQGTTHPYLRSEVYPRWSEYTPQTLRSEKERVIADAKEQLAKISNLSIEETCWENTFGAFDKAVTPIEYLGGVLSTLSTMGLNDEYETIFVECVKEYVELFHDEKLWHVLKSSAEQPWVKDLSPERQCAVKQLCKIFKQQGAHLSASGRERAVQIAAIITELSFQYEQNIRAANEAAQWHYIGKPSLLSGIPSHVLRRARSNAKSAGVKGYIFCYTDGTLYDAMTLCRTEEMRKSAWEVWAAINSPYMQENEQILAQFLAILHEWATLNGTSSYADFTTQDRMLPTGAAALSFVDDLMHRIKPAFDAEVAEMLRLYNAATHKQVQTLPPWDLPYAQRLYKEAHPLTTSNEVSDCFSRENTLQTVFSLYGTLCGVGFRERVTYCATSETIAPAPDVVEVWHPSVRCFDVYDKQSSELLGILYLDLFSRPNKRQGAWVNFLRPAVSEDDGKNNPPPIVVANFNFNPENSHSLSHWEVESLFHEMGHAMHDILGKACITYLSAPYVENDFIEFPSTLSTYWAMHPVVLAACTYQSEDELPVPTLPFVEFCRGKHKVYAMDLMASLRDARLDIEMHLFYEQKFKGRNLHEVAYAVLQPWEAPLTSMTPCYVLKIPHCVSNNYACGIYSYIWSDVLAADVFSRFEEYGVLNPQIGGEYRRTILEKGATKPAADMLRLFLGRAPRIEPYLKYKGITPAVDKQ